MQLFCQIPPTRCIAIISTRYGDSGSRMVESWACDRHFTGNLLSSGAKDYRIWIGHCHGMNFSGEFWFQNVVVTVLAAPFQNQRIMLRLHCAQNIGRSNSHKVAVMGNAIARNIRGTKIIQNSAVRKVYHNGNVLLSIQMTSGPCYRIPCA